MKNMQFRAYLDLMMVSDPWPLDGQAATLLLDVADEESKRRGFSDWVQAYHDFDGATPDTEESMPVITKPS